MGDCPGALIPNMVFFHILRHLMPFGSERGLLLTVQNLLIAPGGPIWHRRAKGWRMPANTVYVGRPSRWGNGYKVGRDGTAEACVELFIERYVHDTEYRARVRYQLAGKHLACWCPPGAPCHAEVLLQWANTPLSQWRQVCRVCWSLYACCVSSAAASSRAPCPVKPQCRACCRAAAL